MKLAGSNLLTQTAVNICRVQKSTHCAVQIHERWESMTMKTIHKHTLFLLINFAQSCGSKKCMPICASVQTYTHPAQSHWI